MKTTRSASVVLALFGVIVLCAGSNAWAQKKYSPEMRERQTSPASRICSWRYLLLLAPQCVGKRLREVKPSSDTATAI